MKRIHQLSFIVLLFILFFSCKKDENVNSGITITPSDDYFLRKAGDVINFTMKFESRKDLFRYRISQIIDNSSVIIKEQNISGKKIFDWYDYTVPNVFDDYGRHEIKLVFSAYDVDGNIMNRAKTIYVDITERTLSEYAGNTMYSSISSQFNAYDLLTSTPKYSTDSTSHIVDFTVANAGDTLSKIWVSPSGIQFVKLNNFDYGNATDVTVKNAYNSGIKNDTLRFLANDDVIITKISNNYLAIKLIYVIDDVGNTTDRYIFSIKR